MLKKLDMAIDNWFCSVRSHKSSRKSANGHQQVTGRHSEPSQQSESNTPSQHRNHHSSTNGQSSGGNLSYRYVTQDFHSQLTDELTVYKGEYVLYEYSDVSMEKKWSYVCSVARNMRGYVPDEILSSERPVAQGTRKKIPRSIPDSSIDLTHDAANPHRTPCTSYRTCPSNGDSIKFQPPHHLRPEQPPHFDMHPNSLQGSSGCQTVQKFPDWPVSYPGYYNLNMRRPPYEMFNGRPFVCMNHDIYCVFHNFVAREEGDLNVAPGDLVIVLNKDDPDWFYVRRQYDKTEGFVPSQFICPYDQVRSHLDKGNSTITMKSSNHNDFHTYINHAPDRESLPNTERSSLQQI